jgi:hypothetical protein
MGRISNLRWIVMKGLLAALKFGDECLEFRSIHVGWRSLSEHGLVRGFSVYAYISGRMVKLQVDFQPVGKVFGAQKGLAGSLGAMAMLPAMGRFGSRR